jgi:TfoX/Sxy family transcriptional regulator of competence genes
MEGELMPYDEELDERLLQAVAGWGARRIKMFGGTCHLLNGNMVCGVYKDYLILRLGPAEAEQALSRPHVKPFDITGKAMKGWVMVHKAGLSDRALQDWLAEARRFVAVLPPK